MTKSVGVEAYHELHFIIGILLYFSECICLLMYGM
jgi:hypothetical protein